MRTERRFAAVLAMAAAIPAVAATVAILVFCGRDASGDTPFSYGRARNMAEAAAQGDGSEVLRFLRFGEDPNRVEPLRPDIISAQITRATALEAAVWGRRGALMELFDREGTIVDADTRRHLYCLASDARSGEIVDYLSQHGGKTDCVEGREVAGLIERSAKP